MLVKVCDVYYPKGQEESAARWVLDRFDAAHDCGNGCLEAYLNLSEKSI